MAPYLSGQLLCFTSLLFNHVAAHFYLNSPPTIGFDDDLEGTPPCGSFVVDFATDNVTDFSVGGNAVSLTSIHPMATWLFRATLDQTASGNWTDLLPAITQTGLGDFCEPEIVVPASFAGSKGVLQIVQDAPDGILYQCAAVNFVSGMSTPPGVCKNVTGLTATYAADAALSSLPASASVTASTAASTNPAVASTTAAAVSAATVTAAASSVTAAAASPSSSSSKASAASTVKSHGALCVSVWVGMFALGLVGTSLL